MALELTPLRNQSNLQCVKMLEELLEEARSGKILSMAVVYERPGEWEEKWTATVDIYKMIGGAGRLMYRLNTHADLGMT